MGAMDLKIAGSGAVNAGEYNDIRISGSGRLCGLIRCASFKCSGSAGGDAEIVSSGDFGCSGSTKIEKGITARNVNTSGSISCGRINAEGEVKTSGSLSCAGDVKCGILKTSGTAKVDGGIEADEVKISGVMKCGGLINAEKIEMEISQGSSAESIGGGTIIITIGVKGKPLNRLPLFEKLAGAAGVQTFKVKNSIEGDTVAIEGVTCPKVVGRVVAIGDDCNIELVQYTEEIEINPNAKVGRYEKI